MIQSLLRGRRSRRLAAAKVGFVCFARWRDNDGEQIVVTKVATEEIELHCHGGIQASQQILSDLEAIGCQIVPWSEWTQPTGNWIKRQAELLLPRAQTERSFAILHDQMQGACQRELKQIIDLIDQGLTTAAQKRIEQILGRAPLGLHLLLPFRVVIAGPPNVGKSSLLNALMGFSRAIVANAPGTTRDVVSAVTAIEGIPVELIDTAGIRDGEDVVEREGIARAVEVCRQADLLIWVTDASDPATRQVDIPLSTCACLQVINKCDLSPDIATIAMDHGPRPVSAKTGFGIRELALSIMGQLVAEIPQPDTAIPFHPELVAALTRARTAGEEAEWKTAKEHLQTILDRRE